MRGCFQTCMELVIPAFTWRAKSVEELEYSVNLDVDMNKAIEHFSQVTDEYCHNNKLRDIGPEQVLQAYRLLCSHYGLLYEDRPMYTGQHNSLTHVPMYANCENRYRFS